MEVRKKSSEASDGGLGAGPHGRIEKREGDEQGSVRFVLRIVRQT